MDPVKALYRELDPLRPLGADEQALYVDWQPLLDPGGRDAKALLVTTFRRNASPERPLTRLLTGHRGCGKTTELHRVRRALRDGDAGADRVFVSMLPADEWLDLEDVQPEDLVLQIVRQLVTDLGSAGVRLGEPKLRALVGALWERVKRIRPELPDLGVDALRFSFKREQFPTERDTFREILRGQLPTIYALVNDELLPAARRQLAELGYDDLLLIVDDLDRMPQRMLHDGGLTNHQSLFLDGARELRALACSVLLTVPIELAYSPANARLKDIYGAAIATLPLLPVVDRRGARDEHACDALVDVVDRRARTAFASPDGPARACAEAIFGGSDLLQRVVALSGGHLRNLLVIVSELLNWVDELPLDARVVDRYARDSAHNLTRALRATDRELLRRVRDDGRPSDDPRFFELLRSLYVFAYRDDDGDWYGVNPLLREIEL